MNSIHNPSELSTSLTRPERSAVAPASEVSLKLDGIGDTPLNEGQNSPGGINPVTILHALRRNWLLGIVLGVIFAGPLTAITWSLHKLEYKATALVRISPQHIPLLFETADRPGGGGRLDFKSYKNTQRQMLLTPGLLNNALKKDGISDLSLVKNIPDPIAWLQKELKITFPDDAEIMQVSLDSTDSRVAQKLVDAVVSTYNEEVVLVEQNERLKRVDELERVQTEKENEARSKRSELKNLVELLGTSDSSTLNLAQQGAMQHYSLLRSELMKVQFDLMRAEGELQFQSPSRQVQVASAEVVGERVPGQLQSDETVAKSTPTVEAKPDLQIEIPSITPSPNSNTPPKVDEIRLAQLVESDPVGSKLTRKVEQLTNLIQQTEQRLDAKAAAPLIEKYRVDLNESQQKVAERTHRLSDLLLGMSTGSGSNTTTLLNNVTYKDLPKEIQILKTQERRLLDDLKKQEAEGKKFGQSSIDVEMMKTAVEGYDKRVASVTDELERTKIELKSNSRITILGPAQVPQVGLSKTRLPLTAAIGFLGLFGPLLLFMGLDLRHHYVNGSKTMSDEMQVPVLGSLPLIPRRFMKQPEGKSSSKASVWRRRIGESVSAVTSLLLRKLAIEGHRVILITSAIPGEGKSTLAEQLANSLANSGRRTLLIDFDLRRPILHRRYNVSVEPGVTDVLRTGLDLEQAVQHGKTSNLSLLTVGKCPGTLLQDSANGSLKMLFERARASYEIVIVDSSPLLPVMDGRLVGQHADTAILSVIKDVSQVPSLIAARNIMQEYGIPILGCVVTGDSGDNYYANYMSLESNLPQSV